MLKLCSGKKIAHSHIILSAVVADGSENVTGIDLSEFPALADRSRREGNGNPTPLHNPLAGRAPYGTSSFYTVTLLR